MKYSRLDNITIDEAIILTNYEKNAYVPNESILNRMGNKSVDLMMKIGKEKGYFKN